MARTTPTATGNVARMRCGYPRCTETLTWPRDTPFVEKHADAQRHWAAHEARGDRLPPAPTFVPEPLPVAS